MAKLSVVPVLTIEEQLAWLRDLLEDNPTEEIEAVTGDGGTRSYTVSNPPMTADSLKVLVDGEQKTLGTDYTVPDAQTISFAQAPAAGTHVVFQYGRQLFSDAELTRYLTTAGEKYTDPPCNSSDIHVYRAAIFAIDALLVGAATALRFGAGAEDFDMPSVFERLLSLRSAWWEQFGGCFELTEGADALTDEPAFVDRADRHADARPDLEEHLVR